MFVIVNVFVLITDFNPYTLFSRMIFVLFLMQYKVSTYCFLHLHYVKISSNVSRDHSLIVALHTH